MASATLNMCAALTAAPGLASRAGAAGRRAPRGPSAAAVAKAVALRASRSLASVSALGTPAKGVGGRKAVRTMAQNEPYNPFRDGSVDDGNGSDVYVVDNSTPTLLQGDVRRHVTQSKGDCSGDSDKLSESKPLSLISVYVSDERGMINRVAGVFARRGFNIESLAVGLWGPQQDKALFTVVVLGEDKVIKALIKQVYKLPSVKKVVLLTDTPKVERGLVLMKVSTPPGKRSEILELVDIFRGMVVDVSDDCLIIAATGDSGKGIALQRAMSKYGIRQIARTGRVSLARELPQEALRRRLQTERTLEVDDLEELKKLEAQSGVSARAVVINNEMESETGVYASATTATDWMGIWDMDGFDESNNELPPGLEAHTLSVVVDNISGVLDRVTGVVARRGYNVQSLAVGPSEKKGVSRITMVIPGTDQSIAALLKQLRKLVSVLEAVDISATPFVQRELMLVKVLASNTNRHELMNIAQIFRAKVSDVSYDCMVLEIVGDSDKMTAVLQMLQGYGIVEVARTGRVALPRDNGVDSRMLNKVEMDSFF